MDRCHNTWISVPDLPATQRHLDFIFVVGLRDGCSTPCPSPITLIDLASLNDFYIFVLPTLGFLKAHVIIRR